MILNNLKKILFQGILGSQATGGNNTYYGGTTLVDTSGNYFVTSQTYYGTSYADSIVNAFNHMATAPTDGCINMGLGVGTTTPTADDYNIETSVNGIICDSAVATVTSNLTKLYSAIFTNTTANDINITEVGLFLTVYANVANVMIEHTVLDNPITIPSNSSVFISLELAM